MDIMENINSTNLWRNMLVIIGTNLAFACNYKSGSCRSFVGMIVLLLPITVTSVTGCPCRYCGPATLCHQMNLREVPYTIPRSDVIRLLLYGNKIKKLSANEFQGMLRVTELDLHSNEISIVEKDAFKGLERLESLHLSQNEIEYLPEGALLSMPVLSRLFLDNNKLKQLPADVPFLGDLTKLNLGFNQITAIQWSSFFTLNKLESVIIWSNPLQCNCNTHELIKWFTTTSKGLALTTDTNTMTCNEEDIKENCSDVKIIQVTHLSVDGTRKTDDAPSTTGVYIQSDSAALHCNATGNPKPLIVWKTPSSGYVYPYSNSRLTAYFNGTLKISSLRTSDSGKYSCHPRRADVFSVASSQLELKVVRGTKPKIKAMKDKIQGSTGTELRLQCAAYGNPFPDLQWYPPNSVQKLSESNFSRLVDGFSKYTTNANASQLTISNFSEEDAGLWKCRASNSMGFDAAYIQVAYVTSEDNLLLIIIATACVVVVVVVAAVVLVTCLVTRRRRKKSAARQEQLRPAADTRADNTLDSGENEAGAAAAALTATESDVTDVTIFTIDKQKDAGIIILEQPFTNEPEIRGIRI